MKKLTLMAPLVLALFALALRPVSLQAQETNTAVEIESLFVRDIALRDFAELMTRGCAAEWKVLVSEQAGEKRISFYLSDTGIEETLRAICATYGLWYRRSPRSDIIQIVTLAEYQQGLNLYAEEAVEVVPVMYPAPEEIGDALARLFQDRVIWDPPPADIADDMRRIESALDRMDTLADRATLVDTENLNDANSGSRSRFDNNSNNRRKGDSWNNRSDRGDRRSSGRTAEERTIQDVAEQQRRVQEVQQAARGLPGEMGERSNRPGLVYIAASPSANALILRSSDASSIETIKEVIRQLDKPKPQVLLEVKVLDLQFGEDEALGVDWLFQSGSGKGGTTIGGGRATGVTADPGNLIQISDLTTLVPRGTGIDPLSTVFSIVSDNVRARLQFLQDEQRVRSLATPSLLVADNEASRVFIGSEVTVLERVEPQTDYIGTENPQPVTTYSVTSPRKRIGTTLLITPKIHADRTVTIRILQEETRLGSERTVKYGSGVNDQFTSQDVEERSVTTTVLGCDGHTIAIGGLIRTHESERETGVPVLMHIPYLGHLFKRTVRSETRSELLVLIQPHVLLAPGEGATVSQKFLERLSQHPDRLTSSSLIPQASEVSHER